MPRTSRPELLTMKECKIYHHYWSDAYNNMPTDMDEFDNNMEDFELCVNEYLEEGWQPLGPATFKHSTGALRWEYAVITLVREKSVEPAVVVDVPPVVVAENVRPTRQSARLSS